LILTLFIWQKGFKLLSYHTKQHSRTRAEKDFAEWASLFSGKIFVKIAAYLDESGSHDRTGKQKNSGQIVVCGWVDWRSNWIVFCRQWNSILRKYGADYFHFVEWAYAARIARTGQKPSSSFHKNPYRGWSLEKLDSFLYELAELAGGGQKILIGGFISTKDFSAAKKHPAYSHLAPKHGDPYKECLSTFFESFSREVQQQWPYWNESVSFFFDQNKDNKEWNHSVLDAFKAAKNKDSRIAELSFVDKKICPHWPIQAADMLAYRMRQIAENFTDQTIFPNPSKLDDLLIKPSFLRATPSSLQGARTDYLPLLSLRHGNYPWRNKIQS
jgi:hypothetical protein